MYMCMHAYVCKPLQAFVDVLTLAWVCLQGLDMLHVLLTVSGVPRCTCACVPRAGIRMHMWTCRSEKRQERLEVLQALRFSCAVCLCCLLCKGLQGSAGWKSTRHAGLQGHRGVDELIMWTLAKQHTEILGFFKTSYGA